MKPEMNNAVPARKEPSGYSTDWTIIATIDTNCTMPPHMMSANARVLLDDLFAINRSLQDCRSRIRRRCQYRRFPRQRLRLGIYRPPAKERQGLRWQWWTRVLQRRARSLSNRATPVAR